MLYSCCTHAVLSTSVVPEYEYECAHDRFRQFIVSMHIHRLPDSASRFEIETVTSCGAFFSSAFFTSIGGVEGTGTYTIFALATRNVAGGLWVFCSRPCSRLAGQIVATFFRSISLNVVCCFFFSAL